MAMQPPDPIFTLRNMDMGPVHSLAFHSLTGMVDRLLVGTQNGQIMSWNMQTNRLQQKLSPGKSSILKMYHTEDTLIIQEKGGILHIWKLTGNGYSPINTIIFEYCGFCCFEVSEDYNILIIPRPSSKVDILDLSGTKIKTLECNADNLGDVMSLKQFDIGDNPHVLVGYESGEVILWDLNSSQCVSSAKFRECPFTIDYDYVTNKGVIGNTSDFISVFSIDRLNLALVVKSDILIKNSGVSKVKIRPDKKVFVSAGWDGRVRLFSWKTLRPLAVLTEHKAPVQDVVFSNNPLILWNANIMATGSLDGSISLWNLYN